MANRIILLVALAGLLCASATVTATPRKTTPKSRKIMLYAYYSQFLQNDQLRIYEEYGYPVHRLREYAYGRILEHWKYYDAGLEFVFDENSALVETRQFPPENRRERMELFPGY
jgi:hypothetical protein